MIMRELTVGTNEAGLKLKKLCFLYFKGMPDSFTYKMLRKKNILLNDAKATGDEVLKEGDKIQLYFSEETLAGLRNEGAGEKEAIPSLADMPWFSEDRILYENDDYLFIDKPSGILSQRSDEKEYSVNDAVIAYLAEKGVVNNDSLQTFRPSVCNRLDRNTSGIISASKTRKGARELTSYYKSDDGRTMYKYYLTVVHGNCTLKGHFDRLDYVKSRIDNQAYVWLRGSRRPQETMGFGKPEPIHTELLPLSYDKKKDITLMLCRLHTGRSHQIRVTMKHYGYHVVGDPKYGNPVRDHFLNATEMGQLLVAWRLKLPDGTVIKARIPEDILGFFPKAEELAEAKIG